jgi:hypothetical protein
MNFSWKNTPAAIRTALIAAILGFVVRCSSSSTSSRNGRVTECSYFDGGAALFGAVAIVAGLMGVAASWRRKDDKVLMLVISIGSVGVGIVHILRGVGAIGGPCN